MSDTAPYPLNDIAKNLVSNIQGGVIICQYCAQAQAFKTLYISDGWKTLTGYTLLELEERFDGNARALILPEDIEQATRSYIEQTSRDSYYQLEYRFRHKDGHIVWAIDYGIVAHTPDGLAQNQSIVTDISPLKANEEKLRLSEARFRIATKAAHAAVFELDLTVNRYLHIENAEVIFHADEETVLAIVNNAKRGCHPSTYYTNVFRLMHHPDDLRTLENARVQMLQTGISECEVRLHQPNNSYLWCKFLQAVVNDENGNPLRSIGYIADVDEQHRNTAALLSKAESDPLTGLLNKSAIRSKGEQMLSSAPSLAHALFVLDVDNFKHINDSLGHLFGDGVLMDLSAKLRRLFTCDSLLARVGGDEFVVLIRGTLTEEDAAKRAEKICLAFQRSYSGEKAECNISCSVGVALSVPGDSFEQLFHKADRALYHAKEHGKDCYALYRDCAGDHESATELLGDIYIRDAQMSDSGRLQLKERIFELLYRSVDFSSSVNMILSLLGQFLDVNRVYIFENTADNHFFSNIYEWCAEGVTPLRDQLQALPVAKLAYFSRFDSNGIFRCADTSALPAPLRAFYEKHGVHSTFQVSIIENGIIRGFMGYDSMEKTMSMPSDLVDLMTFAAKVTGTFIIKKRADESIRLYNQNKMEALDNLPCAIYVIDDAYRLQYMNNLVLSIFPNVKIGQKCHALFMNNSAPCANCPAKDCRNAPCSTEIYNAGTGLWLLTTAASINWSGRADMRLICCQIINQYKEGMAAHAKTMGGTL